MTPEISRNYDGEVYVLQQNTHFFKYVLFSSTYINESDKVRYYKDNPNKDIILHGVNKLFSLH